MSITDREVQNSILYAENGSPILVDGYNLLMVGSLEHAINKGLIATAESGNCFGYTSTSSTNITVLRATAYTEPASASQMEIVSSSIQDDNTPGGTGTRTLKLTYYDNNMNGPFTEEIQTNGTSAVSTTATNIRFVEKMESLTVGSNGTNVGTITLRLVGGGATVGTIAASDGITFWGHHYVQPNKTCFIKRVFVGALGASGVAFLRSVFPLTTNSFEKQITASVRVITAQPSQIYDMEHFTVVGPARISMWVRADANTATTWHGGFSYYVA